MAHFEPGSTPSVPEGVAIKGSALTFLYTIILAVFAYKIAQTIFYIVKFRVDRLLSKKYGSAEKEKQVEEDEEEEDDFDEPYDPDNSDSSE